MSSWRARPRNYERERRQSALKTSPCTQHPLSAPTTIEAKSLSRSVTSGSSLTSSSAKNDKASVVVKTEVIFDPLSGGMAGGGDPLGAAGADPLSMAVAAVSSVTLSKAAEIGEDEFDVSTFEPWESKKAGILSKYTTSEKLSITTSFLSQSDREKVVVKAQASATMTDKVKNRLEQLDDFEEGSMKEMMDLSQQEYVKRIDELHKAMSDAWEADQRVKTLKIAIQCAKLLGDTNVIKFYPSKFVLITDILDSFGKLVYDRIWRKSTISAPGSSVPVMLPEKFTVDQVPDSAKETCRNWFFKIASIRELVPRFFVETAILRCYNFLTKDEFAEALSRLTNMIRGIGNPLVAVYARCYLCRVGALVAPHVRSHLLPNLYDFMNAYVQIGSDHVNNVLAMQRVDFADYLQLLVPGLEWILQCVSNRAQESVLEDILTRSAGKCNSSLFLHSVLQTFQPSFIASRAAKFVEMIRDCDETGFPKHLLHRVLGMNLLLSDPAPDQRMGILRDVWKDVTKLSTPSDYISCAELWIEFPCKHFGKKNVNTFLGDLIKHMTVDRAFENHYPQLQSMVFKIMAHMHDFSAVFSMDKFLPFIDLFQRDVIKVDVCKIVAETFVRHQVEPTSDPVTVNGMMYICKVLHDSINALSLRDEERQISNFIVNFLRRVTHGRDLEGNLNFLVDARANFSNLQSVIIFLVQKVNSLAVETHRVVKGNHSRKTSAFVRACAAYTYITIPGVTEIFPRLNLYLLSGQVALLNQAITQGDSFFKAAIALIAEVPKTAEFDGVSRSTEAWLVAYVKQLLSVLLVVPDHPEREPLWILQGLMTVLREYNWDEKSDAKAQVFLSILSLLCAAGQDEYCYTVRKVESNDQLYGADRKFIDALSGIINTVVDEMFEILKLLGANKETLPQQASIAVALVKIMLTHMDAREGTTAQIVVKLWNLAGKSGTINKKAAAQTADVARSLAERTGIDVYTNLANRISSAPAV